MPAGKSSSTTRQGIRALNGWTASVYFDPAAKYIWDLALDHAGNLYVATGDHGEIYKVSASGQHSLFFKSDEVHIRVLALDPKGNLIAGSDGSGLIYRIAPNGDAFVLYSAPKKEITALAIDSAGNIYAAGAGEKHSGGGLERRREHHGCPARAIRADFAWAGSPSAPACAKRTCRTVSSSRCGSHWRLGNLSHRARRRTRTFVDFARRSGLRSRI